MKSFYYKGFCYKLIITNLSASSATSILISLEFFKLYRFLCYLGTCLHVYILDSACNQSELEIESKPQIRREQPRFATVLLCYLLRGFHPLSRAGRAQEESWQLSLAHGHVSLHSASEWGAAVFKILWERSSSEISLYSVCSPTFT